MILFLCVRDIIIGFLPVVLLWIPNARFLIRDFWDSEEPPPVIGDAIGFSPCVTWLSFPVTNMTQETMEEEFRTTGSLDSMLALSHNLQLVFRLISESS